MSASIAPTSAAGPTSLDEAIVRNAEATLEIVGRARDAIHSGDLRPGEGRRPCPRHHPVRRPWAARRRARPCQDQAGRDARHRARPRCPPRPVHARPDAVRHPRLRDPRRERGPAPLLPLRQGADLRPAADGRRDQPGEPAHPVGAAAGHAGAPRLGRRRAPRPAAPVPRACDAEPDRAGGHLPAARGAARPLPPRDRRRLSRPRRRAPHPDRDDRRRRLSRRRPVMGGDALLNAQRLVRRLPVGDSVVEAILDLVRAGRPGTASATSPTSCSGVRARAPARR